MRRLLAALVILVVLPPSIAYGSGPSSVLIADPANRIAASAHRGDSSYQRLAAAVGLDGTRLPRSGASPPAVGAVFRADARLTWLRDDTEIWRIDLIFVTPRDGIWIATGRAWISEPADAVWHRPADPALLRATLIESGLAKAIAGAFPPTEPRPDLPSWAYGLAGALAGIMIMLAAHIPQPRDRPAPVPSPRNRSKRAQPGTDEPTPTRQPPSRPGRRL